MATTWDWQSIDRYDPDVGYDEGPGVEYEGDTWEDVPTYVPTEEEAALGAGEQFYLPDDYFEDETGFWSEEIYDIPAEELDYYVDQEFFRDMTTPEIEEFMQPTEEDIAEEEEKDSFWASLLGNKDLMSILAQAGLGALSGYSASRETKPTTRTTGSGGTPTSTAMLQGVGRAVQR